MTILRSQIASVTRYTWENPEESQLVVAALHLSTTDSSEPSYLMAQRFIENKSPYVFEMIRAIGRFLPLSKKDNQRL